MLLVDQKKTKVNLTMNKSLSLYAVNKDNNLNLIRFIAALLVLISHSFALTSGNTNTEPFRLSLGISLGQIAVDIFFIISGFLVTGSYFSKKNVYEFLWARALRIYPALIVSVLFCVFVVGLYFTKYSLSGYIFSVDTYQYIIKNSILLFGVDYHLPGVFLDLPYARAINGSLWTLPHEVRMYLVLGFILYLVLYIETKWKRMVFKRIMFIICSLVFLSYAANYLYVFSQGSFIRLLAMFVLGVTFFIWKEKITLSLNIFCMGVVVLLFSMLMSNILFSIVYFIVLPYLIFFLAYIPAGGVRKFNSIGDYSYGVYIYAFPVQQSIMSIMIDVTSFKMICLSFIFTILLAIISWHIIEKKFLK